MQHVIFFSGLRGAVAFSCAEIFPNLYDSKEVVVTCTTGVILVTMKQQGIFIIPVIQLAKIKTGVVSSARDLQEEVSSNRRSGEDFGPLHIEETYIYPIVIRGRGLTSPRDTGACLSPDSEALSPGGYSSGGGSISNILWTVEIVYYKFEMTFVSGSMLGSSDSDEEEDPGKHSRKCKWFSSLSSIVHLICNIIVQLATAAGTRNQTIVFEPDLRKFCMTPTRLTPGNHLVYHLERRWRILPRRLFQ